jgi:biopolymer transport protein ExbB
MIAAIGVRPRERGPNEEQNAMNLRRFSPDTPARRRSLTILSGLLIAVAGAGSLPAQPPGPAAQPPGPAAQPAAQPAAPAVEQPRSLGDEVFQAPRTLNDWIGVFFYLVLFVFSMISLTVGLERLFNLRREKMMPTALVTQLDQRVQAGRDTPDNLRALAEASDSPLGRVLRDAMLRAGRPLAEVEKGIEDSMAREVLVLRAKQRPLSVMANVGPLVGLFGTVVGMIFAFQVASQAGLGKAEMLAKGIYLALLTTAIGLTIAVPCMLVLAYLNARIDRYVVEMDSVLLRLLPSLGRMEQAAAGRGAR